MKHEITTERILKASERCDSVKEVLKDLFPEAFESKLVDFRKCVLTADPYSTQPFYIGTKGYGPKSMGRVLIARPGYEWRIIPCNANQKVILKRVCK